MSNPPKRVVLGVTGGIAAYKSADLVRRLKERGFDVRVIMTGAARNFVSPLTFQALSSNPVHSDLFDEQAEAAMGHIELARWANLVLVAPASADFIAKLAHGHADDLLSTVCLATTAHIVVAPAMNQQMWMNVATQDNCRRLVERQIRLLGPGEGDQACGETGAGRMLEPIDIADSVAKICAPGCLSNLRVLVTAGPTREAIDPVRYISNHSSGKMGYAVAQAAADAGAHVVLVSGPTSLRVPNGVKGVFVESAAEMHCAVMANVQDTDIFIGAAAVADYAPPTSQTQKIKKNAGSLVLELVKTKDILAAVAALDKRPFTVGFAAETQHLEKHARGKLQRKALDLIAANEVGRPGRGFGADLNQLHLYWEGGDELLPLASKTSLAQALIETVAEHYHAQHSA